MNKEQRQKKKKKTKNLRKPLILLDLIFDEGDQTLKLVKVCSDLAKFYFDFVNFYLEFESEHRSIDLEIIITKGLVCFVMAAVA